MKNTYAQITRRQFIGASAAAAAFAVVPRHVLGRLGFVAPSEKVSIAIIGAGGRGRTMVRDLFNEQDAQIIAVCDVAEKTDLSAFYYGGFAGRKPVKVEVEEHYACRANAIMSQVCQRDYVTPQGERFVAVRPPSVPPEGGNASLGCRAWDGAKG